MCTVLPFRQVLEDLITIIPVSSGHHLGSSNWVLKFPHSNAKLGYMSKTSTIQRYPVKMDDSLLQDLDLLVLGSIVNPIPNYSYDQAMN